MMNALALTQGLYWSRLRMVASITIFSLATMPCMPQRDSNPTPQKWGDQGDGTYANPVLPADFSDLDAIRVGKMYYAMTSTFQYSPGVALLQSKDLVNWKIAGHVVADLTEISPAMNWDTMNRAGRGIWAGSLRFHNGKFWVYFGTPDEGIFVSTAKEIGGPWTPIVKVLASEGWDDPCPFWDDDDQAYLVATYFKRETLNGKAYNVHLFKMKDDGRGLILESDRIMHQSPGSEANKLYKINGLYYHYYSEVAPEGRVIMMGRSKSLGGPWETKQLIHVRAAVDKEPNQGGLIELPSGAWYFLSHQGTGDWEGRAGVLLPVHWIRGWPIIGKPGHDGIGTMVWRGRKPIQGGEMRSIVANDDFSEKTLKPEWEWNYQPRQEMWSLTEKPGALRLHAFPALRPDDLLSVGNVLTQRSMRTSSNQVTVQFDLSGMADGQRGGLVHMTKHYAALEIVQTAGRRSLAYNSSGTILMGPTLDRSTIWMRSQWDFDGVAQFSYSLDGQKYQPFGEPYRMEWGNYRGDRIGLFTENGDTVAGYIDVKSFQYDVAR